MENTWMPKVAGILDIVAGAFGVITSFSLGLWLALFPYFISSEPSEFHDFPVQFVAIFMIPCAVFIFAAGVLAIVGGICDKEEEVGPGTGRFYRRVLRLISPGSGSYNFYGTVQERVRIGHHIQSD